MRPFFKISFFLATLLVAGFFGYPKMQAAFGRIVVFGNQLSLTAGTFFADSGSIADIQNRFKSAAGESRIKIAIVPGHDDDTPGAVYGGLKEANLNLEIGKGLAALFSADPAFQVFLTRDDNGYSPAVWKYFEDSDGKVQDFIDASKNKMRTALNNGYVSPVQGVVHNRADPNVAKRLYAINKWTDDNGIDILIHIHVNDDGDRLAGRPGPYSGLTVYVPDSQYGNAKVSRGVAEAIFKNLNRYFAKSDLPKEDAGVVDDQKLIAVGSNNSLKAASVLIEYGYIYESRFQNSKIRSAIFKEMAWQTYRGVRDFFGSDARTGAGYSTTFLPLGVVQDYRFGAKNIPELLGVQAVLTDRGFYPPAGLSKNDCPISGSFGQCTKTAILRLQNRYGISGEQDSIGPETLAKLKDLAAGEPL